MKMTKMLAILVLALGLAAEVANADFTFGTPTNLGPTVNSSSTDGYPNISFDGLTLYFVSVRSGGYGGMDLWVATRKTKDDDWSTPVNLGPPVNSSSNETCPNISSDGLTLYFSEYGLSAFDYGSSGWRHGGFGECDIWMATRATTNDDWGEPVNLGPTINSSSHDIAPCISIDGLSLYFVSFRPGSLGGGDLYVGTRATIEDGWGTPVWLGSTLNVVQVDGAPEISADGRTLFFFRGPAPYHIRMNIRATTDDDWGVPVRLEPPINNSYNSGGPQISADGHTFFFNSNRPGGVGDYDLWQAPIQPIVDLNGDGIVDSDDTRIMIDYWHTNESLCDIGPTPLGDGIIDAQDLLVLLEHLLLEDVSLIAHWKLEETEGIIAHNSINGKHGTVNGNPAWQPEGGMVDGALQLDGIDDYISTPFVLNPADDKFSVFVWIKGVSPGQAVLSQASGANWLCTDSLEGNLMTELKGPGRGAAELPSQTIITDGNWHRIGLVWDGSHRTLYVDDVAVAEDTQTNLEGSNNGLYIGTGKAMEAGSFWSGLIDDVRIYNRAVSP